MKPTLAIFKMLFLFILVACAGSSASASQESVNYLTVDTSAERYFRVTGDGFENGVEILVTVFGKKEHPEEVLVDVEFPEADNYAACKLSQIKPLFANQLPTTVSGYANHQYAITVTTAVVADTGGCLIWVKNAQDRATHVIVEYSYVTDY